jgi:ATP-dependent helicase/nuclease subunit B
LLLEAAMAERGGFRDTRAGSAAELLYWHLSGGHEPGKEYPLFKRNQADLPGAVTEAIESLERLIDAFDAPDRAYLSCPNPAVAPRFTDYAQLARVAEWSAAGDGDE